MQFGLVRGVVEAPQCGARTASCVWCGSPLTGCPSRSTTWAHVTATTTCPWRPSTDPSENADLAVCEAVAADDVAVLYAYSPPCFQDRAVLCLADSHDVRSSHWRVSSLMPEPGMFALQGATSPRRVGSFQVVQAVDARAGLKIDSIRPLDDEARRILDRFHRFGMVRIDPTSSGLPAWRAVRAPPGSGKTTLLSQLAASWPEVSFLVVTFVSSTANDIRRKIGHNANVTVRTLDAICYANVGDPSKPCGNLNAQLLVESFYPRCRPWYRKKNVDSLQHVAAALASRVGDGEPRMCGRHKEVEWIARGLCARMPGQSAWAEARNTFEAMRARCSALPVVSAGTPKAPHVVLIDEAQDLTHQGTSILRRIGCPIVAVGDPQQMIYDFEAAACPHCGDSGALPTTDKPDWCDALQSVPLYVTHRLDALTCAVLREWTRHRVDCVPATVAHPSVRIQWQDRAPVDDEDGALILLRRKVDLVRLFIMSARNLAVVGGVAIADALTRTAPQSCGPRFTTALEAMARKLRKEGGLDEVAARLRAADVDLGASDSRVVLCTIHRCKGCEADHVAVPASTVRALMKPDVSEVRVAIVALTRHRRRLTIFASIESPG